MKKLLFVDGCIKATESRTKRIADAFINELLVSGLYEVNTVRLDESNLVPMGLKEYKHRRKLIDEQKTDDSLFNYSKQFAEADLVVVGAPFWDMSFPSKVKVYFENIAVAGFTFINTPDGSSVGVCKAECMVYITTRGMAIDDGHIMEQASPYLKALTLFFGINEFEMVSAFGLDMCSAAETENRIGRAREQAIQLAHKIIAKEKGNK